MSHENAFGDDTEEYTGEEYYDTEAHSSDLGQQEITMGEVIFGESSVPSFDHTAIESDYGATN